MGSFTVDLTKFVEKAKVKPELIMKKVCFDIYARIVTRTPVDTGRARANWQIQPGAMNSSTIDTGFEKREKGKRWERGGGETGFGQALLRTDIRATATGLKGIDLGKAMVVYIFNNVKYIKILEDGRQGNRGSHQAPHGMVKVTITEFQSFVRKAVASL